MLGRSHHEFVPSAARERRERDAAVSQSLLDCHSAGLCCRRSGLAHAIKKARFLRPPFVAFSQAAGRKPREATRLATPSTTATSGIGHHQCSQRAASPWPLSRPAQNVPRTTSSDPAAKATRLTVWKVYGSPDEEAASAAPRFRTKRPDPKRLISPRAGEGLAVDDAALSGRSYLDAGVRYFLRSERLGFA